MAVKKANHRETRSNVVAEKKARHRKKESTPAEENIAVYAVYRNQAEIKSGVSALKDAGFRDADISASALASVDNVPALVDDVIGTTAAVTGGMLGWISSMIVAGPLMVAAPIVGALGVGMGTMWKGLPGPGMPASPKRQTPVVKTTGVLLTVNCENRDSAERASKVLESTRADDIALSEGPQEKDLHNREYRDEEGHIHHHTHAYLREHGEEKLARQA